ncbi:DNA polymerase III subunit beta [Priestia megaterium]|uniref:DNA polymerase III subunit beta n=1 Tax=Priestia megaterium TaxID=1404 RepID=UPI000D50D7CF|nr:DNA polymerase III subunit beta [Priestia megaterium]PVC74961.1 DNA polymerase III subunit beta [Priestia megaterium]
MSEPVVAVGVPAPVLNREEVQEVSTQEPSVLSVDINVEKIDAEIEKELKTNVTLAIQTEVLKKAVGKVERSISKKAVQDVFKMIYIDIQPDTLTFRGINSDFMTEATVTQNADQTNFKVTEGKGNSICFPGDKFIQIVKKLNAKKTEIRIEENQALIKSGRPKFDLVGIDGDEFPRTPELEEGTSIPMHPQVLSMMYDRTIYAASSKESRPVLTGVLHHLNGTKLKCVATDAHRLGQFVYELEEEHEELSATIPIKVLTEAKKHLDATEVEVIIHYHGTQVVYEFEDVKVYGRTIEGNYPDTDRLIFSSDNTGSSIVVNAGAFKELLSNSTVYNPDQPIIIRIKPELNQLRVNTREAQVGAFQEDLAVTGGEGADLVVGVNVRYLQEAFARYGNDDSIKLEFLPAVGDKPTGMQPFKGSLLNGNPDCVELFVPVRSVEIDYHKPVEIEDFQGVAEFDFDPFKSDFEDIA